MKLYYKIILIVLIIGFLTSLAFLYRDFGLFQQAAVSIPTFDKPISEMSVEELQAKIIEIKNAIIQLQALLMQITGPDRIIQEIPSDFLFKRNLISGLKGIDVKYLQISLNSYPDTQIAETGYGSPGYETMFFGWRTRQAVLRFQQKYWREISLIPKYQGVGFVEYQTRNKLNGLLTEYRALAAASLPEPTPVPLLPEPVLPLPPSPLDICGENDSICPSICHYPEDLDCSYCGDYTIQTPNNDYENEVCDGLDLGGETCVSRGYGSGELACLNDCSGFNINNCSAASPPQIAKPVISPETIIPKPQNIRMLSSLAVEIDSSWKIAADLSNEDENFAANYLKDKILESGMNIGIADINSAPQNKRIIIGNPSINPTIAQITALKGIDVNSELQKGFNQGYVLIIEPDEILILAKSNAGTFYGVISLTWLLKNRGGLIILPHTKIIDWPDLEIRGFFGWFNEFSGSSNASSEEEWINYLTKYKYNMWVQGLPGLNNNSTSYNINRSLERKKYLVKRHFYTIVALQPTSVKYYNPNFYEGIYAYNISMKFDNVDKAVSLEEDTFQLPNGDFEDDENGDNFPDYWKITWGYPEGNWTWDCSESYSRSCSAKLNLLKNINESTKALITADSSSFNMKRFDLEPNKLYLLSFWAKKTETENSGRDPQVTVVMRNPANNKKFTQSALVDIAGEWKKYYIKFSTVNNYTKMYIYSRAYGTNALSLWLDDFEIVELTDKLYNVIRTPDTRLHVWNKDRTLEYEEGRDYQLIESGKFNIINPLEGKQTIIKRISSGNILADAEIKIDYDFAVTLESSKQQWVTMSDPSFYDEYENILVEPSMTNLKPEYVFINIDEVRGVNRDSRAQKRGVENYELLADFTNRVVDVIKSYDPNVRIMSWDDMWNPYHNGSDENYQVRYGGPPGAMALALDLINKDIIQIPWWYGADDYKGKMEMSPPLFNEKGFKFLGGPGVYVSVENIRIWSELSYKYRALGMLGHSFHGILDYVPEVANYSWNAIKQ